MIIDRVVRMYKILKESKYHQQVEQAVSLCFDGQLNEAEKLIESLPKEEVLLAQLLEKLKGKSVETNIKKLLNGKINTIEEMLVVVSSLKTHCLLEIKNDPQYLLLLEVVENKYNVLRRQLTEGLN